MKKISLMLMLFVGSAYFASAQTKPTSKAIAFSKVDASPLDVVYFPLNTTKSKDGVEPVVRVLYSRPQKKGRDIFGVLEQFDKVWRFGANESTEIHFFKPVTIGDKKIKPGRYSLFAIPTKDKWTVIVNKQTDKWGAFSYKQDLDVARVDIPTTTPNKPVEAFSITFVENETGANLVMAWDNTQAELPIVFKK
jgi:hypothetical protein